jgi:hypothetical protein
MTLKKIEVNASTGETIERDYNEAEIAQHEVGLAYEAELEAKAKADAKAKEALLKKLGITAEEAALLLA